MSTAISWTDETWNPVTGCTRVSAGCANCYASALHNKRFRANVQDVVVFAGVFEPGQRHIRGHESWIEHARRVGAPTDETYAQLGRRLGIKQPYPATYDTPFAVVKLHPERLEGPLRWRKPRRVFVNSMSDLFHEEVPDEFLDRVFAVMALTPQHTYQVLTKRPERMREYLYDGSWDDDELPDIRNRIRAAMRPLLDPSGMAPADARAAPLTWPLPNVWLGTSVEDQRSADERLPILLDTPAAVRFVSVEPLLEPVNLSRFLHGPRCSCVRGDDEATLHALGCSRTNWQKRWWVIVGGESGAKRRDCGVEAIVDVVLQCRRAKVPCFVKQNSAFRPGQQGRLPDWVWAKKEMPLTRDEG